VSEGDASPSAVQAAVLVVAVAAALLVGLWRRDAAPPYVITAIDYHFHDAHPTFPIAPGRDLVVKNAGRNLHNVTIPALDLSRDVRPGGELVIADVATAFPGPGEYAMVCLLHQDRGMSGTIVVASG
jgi:plastocyanin